MSEEFDREERAFTEAFKGAVDGESFRPLDPEELKAAAGPQRRIGGPWAKGLAAAAAIVVAVGIGAALLPRAADSTASSGTVAAQPEYAGGAAPMDVSDKATAVPGPTIGPYTPVAGDWEAVTAAPLSPRSYASGVWANGRYYLVGGQADPPCPPTADCLGPNRLLRDGASLDPTTRTWRMISAAPVEISGKPPVVVGQRLYFRVGADSSGPMIYAYDTVADTWTPLPSPAADGELVAAGSRLMSIGDSDEQQPALDELYDPATRTWTRLPDDPLGRSFGREAVWADGKVILFAHKLVANPGSEEPSVLRLAELDLASMTWRRLPDSAVIGGGGVVVGDLIVFPDTGSADGGQVNNWGRSYPMGGIYDPLSGRWRNLPTLRDPGEGLRFVWSGASVADHLVLASGHLLDPAARMWTRLSPPAGGNLQGQTVVMGPDGILLVGGWDGSAHTTRAFVLPLR